MKVSIRLAKVSDLKAYTDMLQQTYQDAYTDESIGLTKECFSKEVFSTADTQKYLRSNLVVNEGQKTWLAFSNSRLVGSATIEDKGDECELRGFYVRPHHQGKGIGKKLWRRALEFAGGKDIVFDIYSHRTKTIEMYKKWGVEIDKRKGVLYRHWPEWPEGLKAKSIYMRYRARD